MTWGLQYKQSVNARYSCIVCTCVHELHHGVFVEGLHPCIWSRLAIASSLDESGGIRLFRGVVPLLLPFPFPFACVISEGKLSFGAEVVRGTNLGLLALELDPSFGRFRERIWMATRSLQADCLNLFSVVTSMALMAASKSAKAYPLLSS